MVDVVVHTHAVYAMASHAICRQAAASHVGFTSNFALYSLFKFDCKSWLKANSFLVFFVEDKENLVNGAKKLSQYASAGGYLTQQLSNGRLSVHEKAVVESTWWLLNNRYSGTINMTKWFWKFFWSRNRITNGVRYRNWIEQLFTLT